MYLFVMILFGNVVVGFVGNVDGVYGLCVFFWLE